MATVDHQTAIHKPRILMILDRLNGRWAGPVCGRFSLNRIKGPFRHHQALGELAPENGGITQFEVGRHGLGLRLDMYMGLRIQDGGATRHSVRKCCSEMEIYDDCSTEIGVNQARDQKKLNFQVLSSRFSRPVSILSPSCGFRLSLFDNKCATLGRSIPIGLMHFYHTGTWHFLAADH